MRNFISEDDIEQAILAKLEDSSFGYDVIRCSASMADKDRLDDGTGRSNKKQCVLPQVLLESLVRINPTIPHEKIAECVSELSQNFDGRDMDEVNYRLYQKIRNGVKVNIKRDGKEEFDFIHLVDFENPQNNTFTAISQMWVFGHYGDRRPDVLLFVNGMPFIFIELKKADHRTGVGVAEAYNKNLLNYRKDIPNLFAFNQLCVLSDGFETKVGAFNATYEYFFEWLRKSEGEKIDRKLIRRSEGLSAECFIEGLLHKETLIDYIENFILFENQKIKIVAKNHQFLGVNNLYNATLRREELNGKLGVFWHTQGSGKSYSMVFFVRKVRRKIKGNFSFLIITDRNELDTQIVKNFRRTETIGDNEACEPKNSAQLREYLQSNRTFIFALIHKFKWDKTAKYPVLSERNDIFVLVDEAHRTQYKTLAENMRTALPNANFVAFTGTPLLGSKRLTNQWFGDYVSEYNFAQSVEDGSTVPLYYSLRVPTAELKNNYLDDDVLQIIEEENLNEQEVKLLENSSSRVLEVIKREDCLDKVARDIVHHFPRRGFLGKGMVVLVDKYTTVKMYDLVQKYWKDEKKNLTIERNNVDRNSEDYRRLTNILKYMDNVEMAVIVSEENDEEEKFAAQDLDITKHRKKMNEKTPEGKDIEDRFKDSRDKLQLVFVCAMWLTGFDVKNLSTLYLDKPMKSHTLMQAIARANRVFPGKTSGLIVDYVNVFDFMQDALADYASGDNGDEFPAKKIGELIALVNNCIGEADNFLLERGVDISKIIAEPNKIEQLKRLAEVYETLLGNDGDFEKFKVILNTLINLYEASKPEIFENQWDDTKFRVLKYLHDLSFRLIDDERLARARAKMASLLDSSVASKSLTDELHDNEKPMNYVIHANRLIDLSKIDVAALRSEIKHTEHKTVEIDNLKEFIEKTVMQMINRNCTRVKFSERFRNIIDRYNAGSTENEAFYEQLMLLVEELKAENSRAATNGLTEEELEIYDLLVMGKDLSKAEEQKVILAAKDLFLKLKENKERLLVVDWYKDEMPRERVKTLIEESLDLLPECYDKNLFDAKSNLLLNHFIDMAVQGFGWARGIAS